MDTKKEIEVENPLYEKTERQATKSPPYSSPETRIDLDTGYQKASILQEIEEYKSQIESSDAIRDALESDLNDVKKALSEKEKEVGELNSQLISIKKQLPTIKGLEDEIAFLNEDLENNRDKLDSLEEQLQDKETTIKDLQSKLISSEEEKSRVIKETMSEVQKSRDLQRELTNVTRERDKALMKIMPLESEVKQLRESRNALEEIYKALASTKITTKK